MFFIFSFLKTKFYFDSTALSIIIIINIIPCKFLHRLWPLVFHQSLSDSTSPQVSRILLSLLVDLSNVVIWMISARSLIFNYFRLHFKPLGIVPNSAITIGITVTLILHCLYYYYYYYSLRVFFNNLANGVSLKFEWQQVSSCLQDSSQYSERSQQCCIRNGFHLSYYFQDFQFLYSYFGIVLSSPVTISITDTFMLQDFFHLSSKILLFISLFAFFYFYSVVCRNDKVHNSTGSLFIFVDIARSGRLVEIWLSLCISKPQRSLCVSFSRTDYGSCIYPLFIWLNINFLHNSQWITLPTHICLVLYSFCANLLHSLIWWLIVLYLSPQNLHLLFCCVLSFSSLK